MLAVEELDWAKDWICSVAHWSRMASLGVKCAAYGRRLALILESKSRVLICLLSALCSADSAQNSSLAWRSRAGDPNLTLLVLAMQMI